MSTDAQTRIEALQQELESTRETFITARELLDADDQTIQAYISQDQSSLESTPESLLLQKKFILDSFKINKAHKIIKTGNVIVRNILLKMMLSNTMKY